MTGDTEDLVIQILRRMQTDLSAVREDIGTLKLRMTALEQHFATLIASQAGQSDRVDAIERRLARVERRLDLVDEH